ncbi:hypothetical protein HFD88_009945 [Aspergillus terreus]|nr:hypothetical protein HFD88_009945 [Aspergillus terreus]
MYHASIALGALDLSREMLLTTPLQKKDAVVGALTAYHISVAKLKTEILMHDMTGEGWVKHFLVWDLLKPGSNCPTMLLHEALLDLAAEGFVVRSALSDWYATFQKWSADTSTPAHNPQSLLATIYFHGISIYLSGIFDYRAQFSEIPTPTISRTVVQTHVDAILRMTQIALKTTNLAAVLFFFPLRVAGARVTAAPETESIGAMFRDISKRGFVVADAFMTDLKSLWRRKGI